MSDNNQVGLEQKLPALRAAAEKKAHDVIEKLKALSVTLVLAESCTAGLVSGLLANTSGASKALWGSFVCYMQEAKTAMLDIDDSALSAHGLVSRETVCSMAKGALAKSGAGLAAAVTGFAGSDEGSNADSNNANGTIWVATVTRKREVHAREFFFTGSRNDVRMHAAIAVLDMILEELSSSF